MYLQLVVAGGCGKHCYRLFGLPSIVEAYVPVVDVPNEGWLTPPTAGFVQNHPYFAELRRRNVSFYDKERRLKNVRRSKPKKPSDAFRRHMAALRNWKLDAIDAQDLLEEWELPGDEYGGY